MLSLLDIVNEHFISSYDGDTVLGKSRRRQNSGFVKVFETIDAIILSFIEDKESTAVRMVFWGVCCRTRISFLSSLFEKRINRRIAVTGVVVELKELQAKYISYCIDEAKRIRAYFPGINQDYLMCMMNLRMRCRFWRVVFPQFDPLVFLDGVI